MKTCKTASDAEYRDYDINDFHNYIKGRVLGALNNVAATYKDLKGKVGNFFANIFNGSANTDFYTEANLSIGDLSFTGTLFLEKDDIHFSISNPTDIALDTFASIINSPVTIDSAGITGEFIILKNVVDVGVKTSAKVNKDTTATLTIGAIVSTGSEDAIGVGGGVGISITASTQDGPFGTIKNGQCESLNRNIETASYYESFEWFEMNFGEY